MKKMISVLALCLMLTACSQPVSGDPPITTDPGLSTPPEQETVAPVTPADPLTVEIVSEETQLGGESGKDGMKLLRYPRLSGDANSSVNDVLKSIAERAYTEHTANVQTMIAEGNSFAYTVTEVEVLRNDVALLSVLCRAEIKIDGRLTQRVVYACNLNPATGEEYTADALVSNFSALGKLLREGKGTLVWGSAELSTQTNWDELLVQIKPNYGIYPAVCFDKDGIILNFEVVELLDWNVGYRISYADAAGSLSVQPPVA